MRRLFCLSVVVFSLWVSPEVMAAQKSTEGPPSSFSSRADLVLVPVHVRRHGEHAANLSKESFTLLQDGREQKLSVFEEVRTTTERLQRLPVQPGEFTNELQGDTRIARYTVIAIDRINTTTLDMNRLREGLLKFLSQTAAGGEAIRVVAINPDSLEIIQDFTTDPKTIAEALKRADTPAGRERPGDAKFDEGMRELETIALAMIDDGAEGAAVRAESLLRSLDSQKAQEQQAIHFRDRAGRINSLEALQQVALSLAGLPGRKSVVWATSGYPFIGSAGQYRNSTVQEGTSVGIAAGLGFSVGGVLEASALDEYTTHLLNTANVSVYPVDARGTVNTAYEVMDPSRKYSPSYAEKQDAQARNQDVITTYEHLAAATGGKPCYERADLSGCFKDALDDSRDYYLVGYYLDRQKLQPGWHKINVKVAENGVSVRSRSGFVLPKFNLEQSRKAEMTLEMNSRLLDPGIPFRGRFGAITPKGDKRAVAVELHISSAANVISRESSRMDLDVIGVARKSDGSVAGQFSQHLDRQLPPEAVATIQSSGIAYKNVLEVPPGIYIARFVVRDNLTGRMGSVSSYLKVE